MKHFSSSIFLFFAIVYLVSAATVPAVKSQQQILVNATQSNQAGAVPVTQKTIVLLNQEQVQDPQVNRALLFDSIFNIPISTLRSINELVKNFAVNLQAIGSRFSNRNAAVVEDMTEVEILEL